MDEVFSHSSTYSTMQSVVKDAKSIRDSLMGAYQNTSVRVSELKRNNKHIRNVFQWFSKKSEDPENNGPSSFDEEYEDFDAGYRHDEDDEEQTQVLDAEQMRTFVADQTREMHKIGEKKLESRLYITSTIIENINLRSSETLAMLKTVDSTTAAIANKLDILVKSTETMLERIRKEQNMQRMHDYSGRLTVGTLGSYIKNNRKKVTKTFVESLMDMTGLAALDRELNEVTQSFQHNMLMKIFDLPFIKKYMNPFDQRTRDYSTYVDSANNREAAIFDNMTRKSIVTIIPDYLKQITAIVTGKKYNVSSSGALTTAAIENKFVKSIDATFETASFSDKSFEAMTSQARQIDKDFSSADMREVVRVLVEQYVYRMYSAPDAKNHLSPKFFENGGDRALHLHVAKLLEKGKGKTAQYWLDIINTFTTKLVIDKNFRTNMAASINKALYALDSAAKRNIAEAQTVSDTQFTQQMFDDRALARMSHDSSEFEYEGQTLRQLVKKGIVKMESLTEEERRNLDKPIKKFSEIADKIIDDTDDTSQKLFGMQDDTLQYLTSIFAKLNEGINVHFMKKRRSPFAKMKSTVIYDLTPPKIEKNEPVESIPEELPAPIPPQQPEQPESTSDTDEEERLNEATSVLTASAMMGVTNPAQVLSTIGPMQNMNIQQRIKTIATGTIERNSKKEPGKSRLGKIFAFVFAIGKGFITKILSGAKLFLNNKVTNFVKSMMESSVNKIKTGASAVKEAFKGSEQSVGLLARAKEKKETKATKKNKPTMESITQKDITMAKFKEKLQSFSPMKKLSSIGDKIKDKLGKSQFGQGILASFKQKERSKFKIMNLGDQSTQKIESLLASPLPMGSIFSAFLDAFDKVKQDIQDWFDALSEKQDAEKKKKENAEKQAKKKQHTAAFDFGKIVGGLLGMLSGLIQAALTVVMSMKGVQQIMNLVHKVLENSLKPLNKAFKSLYKAIKPVMKTIQNALKQVVSAVADIVISIVENMQPILEVIGPIIEQMMEVLKPILEMVTGLVEVLVTPLVAVMETTVVPILQGVANSLSIVLGLVQVGFGAALIAGGAIAIGIGAIGKIFGAGSMYDTGKKMFDLGSDMVASGWQSIKTGFSQSLAMLGNMLSGGSTKAQPDDTVVEQKRRTKVVDTLNGSPMDGVYGSGDANAPYKFDDSVQDALATIRELASGIFAMFDPDKDDAASKLQTAKDREAYAKAQIDTADLTEEERKEIDDKAFQMFKNSTVNEQLYGETDEAYRKRYEANKERYWAKAATEILHERVKRVADGTDEGAYALTNKALGLNEDDAFAKEMEAYDSSVKQGSAITAMADFMNAILESDDGYYDEDGEYYYEGGTGDVIQAASETFVATRKAAGHYLQQHGEAVSNVRFDDGQTIDLVSAMCTGMLAAIVKRMGYYLPSNGRAYTDTYQGDPYMTPTIGSRSWGFDNADGHPNIFNRDGTKSDDWIIVKDGSVQSGDFTFAILSYDAVHGHMPVFQNDSGYWFGFNGGRYDSRENSVRLGNYYLSHGALPPSSTPGIQTEGTIYDQQTGATASPLTYRIRYVGPRSKAKRKVKKSSSSSDYRYSGSFVPRATSSDRPESGNKYYITQGAGGWSRAIVGSPTDKWNNVLANCVGYAYGRYHEIAGRKEMDLYDPIDAGKIYDNAVAHGRKVSKKPSLGATLVLGKAGEPGHVASVEKINSDGSIVTSESGYNCSNPFWVQTRSPANNYAEGGYYLKGFVHQDKTIKATAKSTKSTKSSSRSGPTAKATSSATSKKRTTSTKRTTTKRGRNAWLDTVAMMFEGYYYNGDKYYDNVNTHTFKIRDGRTVKARPDCSGMLGAAMTAMGYQLDYPPSSTHYNVTGMNGNLNFIHDPDGSVSKDWKLLKFTGNNLQPGDITGNKYHASFPVTNLSAAYPSGFDAGGTTNIKESAIAAKAYLDGKSDIPWRSAMGSGAFSAGAGAWNIVRYVGDGAVTYDYGDDDYGTTSSSSRRTVARTRQDRVADILSARSAAIKGTSSSTSRASSSKKKTTSSKKKTSTKSTSKGKERLIRSTAEIFEAYQKTNPALTYQCSLWSKPITTRSGHTRQVRPDCSGTISAGIQEMGFTLRSPNGALTGDSGLRSIELGNQSTNTLIFDSPTAKKPSTKWKVLDYSKDKLQRGDITVYPNSGTGKNDGHVTMPITDLQTTPRGFDGGSGLQRTPAAAVAYLAGKKESEIPYPENAGMAKMRKIWRYTGSGDADTSGTMLNVYNPQPVDEFMSTVSTGYNDSIITPDLFEDIPYQVQTGPTFVPSFEESVMQPTEEEAGSRTTIINNFTLVTGLDYIEQHLDEFVNAEFQVQSMEIRKLADAISEEFPEYMDYYFSDDEDEEDIYSVMDDMEIRELLAVAP